jgi:hypothetical protein
MLERKFKHAGDVTEGWSKLRKHNLKTLPNIIKIIKYRRMIRLRHVALMPGDNKCLQNFDLKLTENYK